MILNKYYEVFTVIFLYKLTIISFVARINHIISCHFKTSLIFTLINFIVFDFLYNFIWLNCIGIVRTTT